MGAPSLENVRAEYEAVVRWQWVSDIEEKVLKQRSKLHWLQVGDKNNKAFHTAVKVRETRNAIREIKYPDGSTVTKQEDIKMEAERFFNNFLTYEPLDIGRKTVEEIQSFVPFRCSEEERGRLIRVVSEEEVREVVFRMPSNKSQGPDGVYK